MTSIAGAGGGTVLLASMLQFMNPSEAIPVHGVIQFTSNIARTWLLRKFVKWSIILKFSLMIPLGVYIGLEIFQSINAEDIKKLIGSFIIIALILQNIKFIKKFIISSNWYYIVGLFTGIFAIALTEIGTLGKLMSEAIENTDPNQQEGVASTGASTLQKQRYGILPQIMPVFISQTLYTLESNTRSAIIIGAMGSGGIGMLFLSYMRTGVDFENVAYVAALVLITVMLMDLFSS